MNTCLVCHKITKKFSNRYCSNRCQSINRYNEYIKSWKNGDVDGSRGINTKNISGHIKRYLLEKFDNKCAVCGWNKINPTTNLAPLEVDYIDGNSENNTEKNLRIICPNCHALSPNFRNLNKGRGRKWRSIKYIKN